MSIATAQIPVLDLSPEIEFLWPDLTSSIERVILSGRFILGPELEAFESEVADFLGVRHAIGCNSGTDALVLSLRALKIGHGDEVITTPFTFFATAEAISNVGATPVFVDIDPLSYNIDCSKIEGAITPNTKAILPVHLFGHAASMGAIGAIVERYGLHLIEDVAQGFGGRYGGLRLGTFADISAFSFFPSKNLGAFGDAGLVTTNDDQLATLARMLRTHGGLRKYHNEYIGYNSRLDEIQAAILRVKLPLIDNWNARRRRVAEVYSETLADVPWIVTPQVSNGVEHVFHQYTIRILGRSRDEVAKRLNAAGIATMVYYPVPVHQLSVYGKTRKPNLPNAERASREVLSLPMGPFLSDDVIQDIVGTLHDLG